MHMHIPSHLFIRRSTFVRRKYCAVSVAVLILQQNVTQTKMMPSLTSDFFFFLDFGIHVFILFHLNQESVCMLPVLLHCLPAVQLKPTLATTLLALRLALVPHPCCKLAQPAEELPVQQALVQQAAVGPRIQRHAQ